MRPIEVMVLGLLALSVSVAADNAKTTPAENAVPSVVTANAKATAAPLLVTSLPENVKLIVGIGKTRNYFERVRAIHALGTNLPQDQIKTFYQFLYEKLEKQELGDLEFNGLKNELVVKLIQQDSKPAGWLRATPLEMRCISNVEQVVLVL